MLYWNMPFIYNNRRPISGRECQKNVTALCKWGIL